MHWTGIVGLIIGSLIYPEYNLYWTGVAGSQIYPLHCYCSILNLPFAYDAMDWYCRVTYVPFAQYAVDWYYRVTNLPRKDGI